MADREALRDFQRRLADRLQGVGGAGGQAAWLAVQAGDGRFLIPLAQAGEIFASAGVHPVPHTRPWFLGVASLRGVLHGMTDLSRLLTAHAGYPPRSEPPDAQAQWIAFSPALDMQCALQIDRLAGLRGHEAFTAAHAAPPGAPDWFCGVHRDAQGVHWQALDLLRLSQHPDFLSIGS
jgi:twitching motility protein PilI